MSGTGGIKESATSLSSWYEGREKEGVISYHAIKRVAAQRRRRGEEGMRAIFFRLKGGKRGEALTGGRFFTFQ